MYIALKEVYFGKSKNLLECEKLLAEMKKKYDGKYYDPITVECDPKMKQIGRLLASEFGLKKVLIEVMSLPVANAATLPLSWGIDVMPAARARANLIADKNGFKFKQQVEYVINLIMYTGMICNPNFSAGEIMACIVHEVGHNFQTVIDDTCFMLTDMLQFSRILLMVVTSLSSGNTSGAVQGALLPIIGSSKFKDKLEEIHTKLHEFKLTHNFIRIMNILDGISSTALIQFNYLILALLGYLQAINPAVVLQDITRGLIRTALNPLGYREESIADNFATAYGYGPELSTALLKLETINYEELPLNKLANYITPVGMFLRLGIGLSTAVSSMFDPHPATIERCLAQVRYLRKELEYTSDRESRAILKKQIDEIEQNLENVMRNPNLDKHWDVVSYAMAYMVYSNGGDFRHNVFGRDVQRNIQRTYDDKRTVFKKPKLI